MEAKEGIDVILLIFIATIGILILVFFVVLMVLVYQKRFLASKTQMIDLEKQHQKKLLDATLEIAEHERQKIATNLHDDIGIIFHVLKLNMDRLKRNKDNAELVDKIIAESNASIDNSVDIVRAIYRDIVPPTLKLAGLVKAIRELCRQLSTTGSMEINLSGDEQVSYLDKNTELQLYRLIKEVLNNTLKHARPSKMDINIEKRGTILSVNVLHNGMGITTEKIRELAKTSKGIGLKSILTRSELINASIDFTEPAPDQALVVIRMLLI